TANPDMDDCAPGCAAVPTCGDGIINGSEACDDGEANTETGYNGCTTTCTVGPSCGDGSITGTENCDDGVNDGSYGSCTSACEPGPRCGDNTTQAEWGEECDGGSACTSECRLKCGNGVI